MNHFRKPAAYVSIMPRWLPWHYKLVYASGIIEIALGILLLVPSTRQFAAWGIIALLIVVFPANIQMAVNYINMHHPATWLAILRLPLQFVLIWLAWIYTR
jgi:uncharacterized membrane protein